MKKISIIVPVYNCEQYLDQCIQSVLGQTFTDFELILVNDGSTDNSGNICESYKEKDERVIVLHKENGGGAGATRNLGLSKADAEYVTFMDSDDWMQPDMLECMYSSIAENKADVVICGYRYIFDENRDSDLNYNQSLEPQLVTGAENVKDFFVKYFPDGMVGYPWNKLYRMEIIRKYDLKFPLMRRMQDGIFNLNLFGCIESCCVIDKALYNYRASQSVIKKKLPKDFFDLLESFTNQYYEKMEEWGYDAEAAETPMTSHFLNEFVGCIENIYINEQNGARTRRESLLMYYDKQIVQYMLNRNWNIPRYSRIVLRLYKKKHFALLRSAIGFKYFMKTKMNTLFMKMKKIGN